MEQGTLNLSEREMDSSLTALSFDNIERSSSLEADFSAVQRNQWNDSEQSDEKLP